MSDNEKLTPWNAPIPKTPGPVNIIKLLELGPYKKLPTAKKKKPTAKIPWWAPWRRIFPQNGDQLFNMMNGPFIYVWYGFLMSTSIVSIATDADHNNMLSAGNIGFIGGIMFMTFLHRRSKAMDESMKKLDIDMAKLEAAKKVQDEYRSKYGVQ